jgi:hypothetical protein
VPHLYGCYPGICLTTEEKAWEKLSQGSRDYYGRKVNRNILLEMVLMIRRNINAIQLVKILTTNVNQGMPGAIRSRIFCLPLLVSKNMNYDFCFFHEGKKEGMLRKNIG